MPSENIKEKVATRPREIDSLRKKYQNRKIFSGLHFPVFGLNTDQKKRRIWTLLTNDYCNTFNLISFLRKILFFYKRLLIYMSWNSLDLKAWAEHTLRLECSPGYLGRFCLCPSNEKISWLFYFKPQSCTEENVIRWIFTFTLG